MTLREVIQKSAAFLERHGVESPRLQSELLLGHVLGLPRLQLYLQFERVLTEPEREQLRGLVKRRATREPLQHVLGTASFGGLELVVNRHVLVPRPETELLAERAVEFLQPLLAASVLDLGTGSGCLPIFLAARVPAAILTAVDISAEALAVARANAVRHNVDGRVEFLCGDLFGPLPPAARFDLILSNPPYIPSAEIAELQPEVRDHDPRLALDGGADGLDFYRRLAADAGRFLRAGGKLMVEFGDGQAAVLEKLFAGHNWIVETVVDDYSRRPRIMIARSA